MRIKIGKKFIGEGQPCFVIAEAGVNHNGSINLAKKLIDTAKETGVDAVKFQTFKTEEAMTRQAEQAKYQTENTGKKESQYEMLKRLELSYDSFRMLKKYCDSKKIMFLSTPHSCREDVDFVAALCPVIKVASGDLTNIPMLKYMAGKKLPIILSTGMSTLDEVSEAVRAILPINEELILLHCATNYPAKINEANLKAIQTMAREFNLPIGYSDHTEGINVSLAAVALGACIIEKHFTLDKNMPGPDHKASAEPKELEALVRGVKDVERKLAKKENSDSILKEFNIKTALGNGVKKPNPSEVEVANVARKSIIAGKNIGKGIKIKENMLVIKRPGTGIEPKYINNVVGKTAKKEINRDTLIKFKDLL